MASVRAHRAKWQVRWRQDGKSCSEVFDTEKKAEMFKGLVDGHGQRYPKGWIPGVGFANEEDSGPSLTDWFERYIVASTQSSPQSQKAARRDYANHVPDWLGDKPVALITREDAGLWLNKLKTKPRGGNGQFKDKPLAPKTVHNIHGHVSAALNEAVREGIAPRNPFARMLKATSSKPVEEMIFLTPEEFAIVRDCLSEFWHPFVTFLYGTGLRFSEATALGPEHFDLAHGTVRVDRAWKKADDNSFYLGEPKTDRAKRTIDLGDALVDMVTPMVHAALARPRVLGEPTLVFTNSFERRIVHPTFYSKHWTPAVKAAFDKGVVRHDKFGEVMRPRVHDLRHSHVAYLLAEGVSMYRVSRRLGHASYQTTDQRYSHLLAKRDEQMHQTLGQIPMPAKTGETRRLRVVGKAAKSA